MKKLFFILFVLILFISSCSRGERQDYKVFQVYYLNESGTGIVSKEIVSDMKESIDGENTGGSEEEIDFIIPFLMDAMMNPNSKEEYNSVFEKSVNYLGFVKNDNVIYLNFDENYSKMNSTREIMCRGAIAKTLTQVDGIDYIGIYSDGQAIVDVTGSAVPVFNGSDFIDKTSDVNSYEKIKLKLYFSSKDGEHLKVENRSMFYDINTPMEKLILEELIKGPMNKELIPTISFDTKVLSVTTSNNICYVNFNENFLKGINDQKDYIGIYSIVNSLSELKYIDKVQIIVNGSVNFIYKDSMKLNEPFKRNEEYIEAEDIK